MGIWTRKRGDAMRVWVVMIAAVLVGCTTPPQQHAAKTDTLVHRPQAEVWQRLMTFTTSRQMSLTIVNEQAGLLQATLTSDQLARYADCGQTHSVTLPDPQGSVTVQLAPSGSDTSINVRVVATDRMWLESTGEISRAACTSLGTLEQEIFAAVS
jgi:hypothetical protein